MIISGQGHPSSCKNWSMSKFPSCAAFLKLNGCQGQVCSRSHFIIHASDHHHHQLYHHTDLLIISRLSLHVATEGYQGDHPLLLHRNNSLLRNKRSFCLNPLQYIELTTKSCITIYIFKDISFI